MLYQYIAKSATFVTTGSSRVTQCISLSLWGGHLLGWPPSGGEARRTLLVSSLLEPHEGVSQERVALRD